MKRSAGLLTLLLLLLAPIAQAELKLSNVFSDHMVLQQEMPIRVWGWADPGATVQIGLNAGPEAPIVATKAGEDGKWLVEFEPMKADGKSYELRVTSGDKTITLKDILLGEVWLCSGQSNMEWRVNASANAEEEIANADHPKIRLFNVPNHARQKEPQADAQEAQWKACSPKTVARFSAVGYFFGRSLQGELDVPIGLVGVNWGGQKIEPFTPPVGFAQVPELKNISKAIDALDPASEAGSEARAEYLFKVKAWTDRAAKDLAAGKEIGSAPQLKIDPPARATYIYNGMVAGLTPLSARGVIWYQGESNAGDGLKYNLLKEALVKGWRSTFQNDALAFYWVQLADYGRGTGKPEGGGWGPVREGQRRALRLPNTGMAVIIDIGNPGNIHPLNKQDVGKRLALWALAKNYSKDVVASGPLYKSHTIDGNKAIVTFDYVGSGLTAGTKGGEYRMDPVQFSDDKQLKAFSLRDEQGNWHWANAVITGDTVVVTSDQVAKPTAVRYAYDSVPKVNFYNKEGLPASPFTTTD